MTHFAVTVIGDDVDTLMAPYYEDLDVGYNLYIKDCYEPKYFATEEEMSAKYPDHADKTKYEVYKCNPVAKWDWYVEGGRYSGRLILKDGRCVDSARVSEIDFKAIKDKYEAEYAKDWDTTIGKLKPTHEELAAHRTWKSVLDDESIPDLDDKRTFYRSQPLVQRGAEEAKCYFVDLYNCTREEYIRRYGMFCTLAVLTKDGWYEKGEAGWWGTIHNAKDDAAWAEEYEKLTTNLPPDTLITIVDAHI